MRRSTACLALVTIAALLMCGCDTGRDHINKKNPYEIKKNYVSSHQKINDRTGAPKSGEESDPEPTPDYTSPRVTSRNATPTPTPVPNTPVIQNGRQYIYDIADIDWARQNAPNFGVSTPEQFAGAVKYINEEYVNNDGVGVTIYILNDLDLDGYEWVPMNDFTGNLDGQGHTIRNIHLNNPLDGHNGIIGCNGGAIGIFNIKVENAEVNGGNYAGIFVAQGYMLNFVDVYGSGTVDSNGSYVGALIGRTSPSMTYGGCSMDVKVNGYTSQFYSYTQENESNADKYAREIYKLTLKKDHTVVRSDEKHNAWNLGWRIIYNGDIVLERNAENELEYKYFRNDPGTYKIYLVEYNSEFGGYVRVSNEVEYTI